MDNIFGYKISDSEYDQMKIIETPRFILRPFTLNDTSDLFEYLSQEKVVRFLPFKAHKSLRDTRKFIKSFFISNYRNGSVGNYAVYHKSDKKVIGNTGINNINTRLNEGEIGICIHPDYWGNNFATELTIISLIAGFELMDLDKLVAITYSENKYTPKVLNTLRFKYIKTYKPNKNIAVSHRFELTKQDYLEIKKEYLPNLIKSLYK